MSLISKPTSKMRWKGSKSSWRGRITHKEADRPTFAVQSACSTSGRCGTAALYEVDSIRTQLKRFNFDCWQIVMYLQACMAICQQLQLERMYYGQVRTTRPTHVSLNGRGSPCLSPCPTFFSTFSFSIDQLLTCNVIIGGPYPRIHSWIVALKDEFAIRGKIELGRIHLVEGPAELLSVRTEAQFAQEELTSLTY